MFRLGISVCLSSYALTNGIPHSLQEGKVGTVCISGVCVVSASFGVTVHCVHFEKQVIDFFVTFSEKSFEKIRWEEKETHTSLVKLKQQNSGDFKEGKPD